MDRDFDDSFNLDEYFKAEKERKELFCQSLERYKTIASEYLERGETEDVDELFNVDYYDFINSIGYVTIKQISENSYSIDSMELDAQIDENSIKDLKDIKFSKQSFLSYQNPEMLIFQTTGYLGDDYAGYMLFPIPNSKKYWMVQYSC